MVGQSAGQRAGLSPTALAEVATVPELARVLRQLRRRHARRGGAAELTYRDVAEATGWSQSAIGEYFAGETLPPTDRFDTLVRLLGAAPEEQGALATVRDRVDECRRRTPSSAGSAMPRQLPADTPGFTGRTAPLAELDRAAAEDPAGVTVVVVSGTAGVGKTALAVHWAHRAADRFPDGQLYVNLRGFDPTGPATGPDEAVRGFLDALGVPPHRIPSGLDARAARYRSLLANRRMLVVLDNARDADQVRPLLPGSASCLVVVTSRDQMPGLVAAAGARPLALDLLTSREATRLLERRLGAERVAAEPEAAGRIVAACAHLPLALAIVAARAATRTAVPLAVLVDELRAGLDGFAHGDPATDVRAVFSWSLRTLSAPAARLFRLLSAHPGPDITPAAAASLAGVPPRPAAQSVDELLRANLLAEPVAGRLAFHDLLRAYAGELATEAERQAAVGRALDHYLHSAYAAQGIVNPLREPIDLPVAGPDVTPETFADRERAMDWLAAEHRVLLGMIDRAEASGADAYAWQLPWALAPYFSLRGHHLDLATTQDTALRAARRLGDRRAQAECHRSLARAHAWQGGNVEAVHHLDRALELYTEIDDRVGQAAIRLNVGSVLTRQGRHREALDHAQQAYDLYEAMGRRAWQARSLDAIGWLRAQLGEYAEAQVYCRRALALHQEVGDRHGEAEAWDSLGYTHHHLGDHTDAAACYGQAIALYHALGDRFQEGTSLANLGDTYEAVGDPAAACTARRQALAILDEIDHPDADAVRAKLPS